MAKKGRDKNTKNKAKHSKLMARKKKKQKQTEQQREVRLNELKAMIKQSKD